MIRVELGPEGAWLVEGLPVEGRSRTPLLDACRKLEARGIDPSTRIGLFRPGRPDADISCSVGVGAATSVDENRARFVPFKPFMGQVK